MMKSKDKINASPFTKKILKLIQKTFLIAFFPISLVVILSLHNYYTSPRYELPDEQFFTSFEHIKTDQFIWDENAGFGGIYWVSDNEVVLDALIEGERGIYQVNVLDGSYIQLVTYPRKRYPYCFTEGTLYVSVAPPGPLLSILHLPEHYLIKSTFRDVGLKDGFMVSGVRCGFYKYPKRIEGKYFAGTWALLRKDGLLARTYGDDNNPSLAVYLVDDIGNIVRPITEDPTIAKRVGISPFYISFRDAYFGFEPSSSRCSSVWWLNRQDWEFSAELVCLAVWKGKGSKVVKPSKVGYYVEIHSNFTPDLPKVYLVSDEKEFPIQISSARGSSTAPDGCRVAYGSGDYRTRKGDTDLRQHLKVFNACEFIKSK